MSGRQMAVTSGSELERAITRAEGDPNPFIDRAGYLTHIDTQERRFLEMLAEQEAAR